MRMVPGVHLTYRTWRGIWAFLFLLPSLILFGLIVVYPLGWAAWISLNDWGFLRLPAFIGMGNYARLLADPLFWKSLKVTLLWTVVVVPAILVFSLPLALILNAGWVKLKGLFRGIYFAPVVTNIVAAAFVWRWMFEPGTGVVNWILGSLGLGKPGWLADPAWALWAVMVVGVWKQIGQAHGPLLGWTSDHP
ncbi:MAG: sugar ABC transporter permease [Limnochordaceae bacterium]|nr:sugar ABC transporter permease [Limnochordaceae bacterium]